MYDIKFNADTHTYEFNGRKIPSVTQILKRRGLIEGEEWFTDEARDRGDAVHAACHYMVEDDIDWATVDPEIIGYLKGFRQWRIDTNPEILAVEPIWYHPQYIYAGKPDLVVRINNEIWVIDIKTGAFKKIHELQLAGYDGLVYHNLSESPRKWAVLQLREDGTYRIHSIQERKKARTLFHYALELTRFMGE